MHTYNLQNTQIIIRKTNNIRKVYVELSSECNFDCEMCFRQSFSSDVGSMSEELLKKVQTEIETLPELKEVVLGGLGEPLLHPRIIEFIAFLKHKDISITITTNGALMESFTDFFIEQGVDKLVLSFETGDIGHSNEKDIFNTIKRITGRKETFHKPKPSIFIFMVVTAENIKEVYGAEDCVYTHPVNGLPTVLLKASNSRHDRATNVNNPEELERKGESNASI